MKYLLIGLSVWMLAGCVSISDIDVSKSEPNCARECTIAYSSCISAPTVGTPSVLYYQCKEAFKVCIQTCPAK